MRNKKKIAILLAAVCMTSGAAAVTIGCSKSVPPSGPSVVEPDVTVTLDKKSITLDPHETVKLDATCVGSTDDIAWESSDPSIASVSSDGLVTAIKTGVVTITAKVGDVTATCAVTVAESGASPELTVDAAGGVINVGKNGEVTLNAGITFKGKPVTDDIAVSWSLKSGEPQDIAALTPNVGGKSAVIKGLKYGRTAIEVSAVVWGVPILETFVVNVINVDITFEVADATPEAGGYATRVSVYDMDGHSTERNIAVSVFNKGVKVQDPVFVWSSSDDNIVTVDSTGKLKGISAGTATVTGIYDDGIPLTLFVNVYRPEIAVATPFEFETYTGVSFTFDSAYVGTPQKVIVAGKDAMASYDDATRTIELDKTKLPVSAKELGKTSLTVVTEKVEYVYENIEMYTKKISNKTELAQLSSYLTKTVAGSNGNDESANFYWWDGYIVLADNIDFEGDTFDSFIYWRTNNLQDGTRSGFRGVFDGCGHIIDNMKIDGNNQRIGGFIGLLATDGVIQNVAFTNAVHTGYCGYVCSAGDGTIKNVYVSYSSFGRGEASNNERSGTFFAHSSGANANISDCFVEVKKYEGEIEAYSIGSNCVGNVERVFGVGFGQGFYDYSEPADDNSGAFATYADMKNAGIDLDGLSTDFWKIVNGIPYPKKLTQVPEQTTTDLNATVVGVNAFNGSTVDVNGKEITLLGLYDRYTATVVDGMVSVTGIVPGSYKVTSDKTIKSSYVTFGGGEIEISLLYLGRSTVPTDINTTSLTYSGVINDGEAGQYLIDEFGNSRNFTYLISSKAYDSLELKTNFSATNFTGWKNHKGIELIFENGKGLYLEFDSENGNKLSFIKDFKDDENNKGAASKYAITDGVINEKEIVVCADLGQAWANKLNSENGLNISVVRNGKVVSVYIEDEFVKNVVLPDEYAEQTVKYAFCGIWTKVESFAFSCTSALPSAGSVEVTGLGTYTGGSATYNPKQYKIGDEIVVDITPDNGYIVGFVTVNGTNMTAQWANNKLVLGYAVDATQTFNVSVTFIEGGEADLDATVSAVNALDGSVIDLSGKTLTLVGADGKEHTVNIGANGAVSGVLAKGFYSVSLGDGFDEKQIIFDGTTVGALNFTYSGTVIKPPKANGDEYIYVGYISDECATGQYSMTLDRRPDVPGKDGEKFNYAISAANYDALTISARYKDFGAWFNHMGIELVFDDGDGHFTNGVFLEFNNYGDKLSFVKEFWDSHLVGSNYAIKNLINTEETIVKSDYGFADRLNSDGVLLTVVRNGNNITVLVDGEYAATLSLPQEYAQRKVIYAFCGLNAHYNEFVYSVSDSAISAGAVTVNGIAESYTGGTVSYTPKTYALGDEIVVDITPSADYSVVVTVNGTNFTDRWADNKLVIGRVTAKPQTFNVQVSFVSATPDLNATVSAVSAITGGSVSVTGKQINFVDADGNSHTATIDASGKVTLGTMNKGDYTVTLCDDFRDVPVKFNGSALEIEFKYLGESISVADNQIPADKATGQYRTSFGGDDYANKVCVTSAAEYDVLNVSAIFKSEYSALSTQRMGMQLVFGENKGVYLALSPIFANDRVAGYNLSLVDAFEDNGGEDFALTGGLLASNTSLLDCKPIKTEWLNKFTGEGLKLSLVRKGKYVAAYVENQPVGMVVLPDECATQKVKYAFCGRWAKFPDFIFDVSTALPTVSSETSTLTAAVKAIGSLSGEVKDINGSKVFLTDINGDSKNETVTNGKIEIADLKKGVYIASTDKEGCNTVCVIFDGSTIDLKFTDSSFDRLSVENQGTIPTDKITGQFIVPFGPSNGGSTYIRSGAVYSELKITANFKECFSATGTQSMGLQLIFDDGKGLYIELSRNWGDQSDFYYNIDFVRNGSTSYPIAYAIADGNLIEINDEISGCKPIDSKLRDKYRSSDGLNISLERNENKISIYVDGTKVKDITVDEKYKTSKVGFAVCSKWAESTNDLCFAVTGKVVTEQE